eukprot:4144831-Amphidinium_carterae.1
MESETLSKTTSLAHMLDGIELTIFPVGMLHNMFHGRSVLFVLAQSCHDSSNFDFSWSVEFVVPGQSQDRDVRSQCCNLVCWVAHVARLLSFFSFLVGVSLELHCVTGAFACAAWSEAFGESWEWPTSMELTQVVNYCLRQTLTLNKAKDRHWSAKSQVSTQDRHWPQAQVCKAKYKTVSHIVLHPSSLLLVPLHPALELEQRKNQTGLADTDIQVRALAVVRVLSK